MENNTISQAIQDWQSHQDKEVRKLDDYIDDVVKVETHILSLPKGNMAIEDILAGTGEMQDQVNEKKEEIQSECQINIELLKQAQGIVDEINSRLKGE